MPDLPQRGQARARGCRRLAASASEIPSPRISGSVSTSALNASGLHSPERAERQRVWPTLPASQTGCRAAVGRVFATRDCDSDTEQTAASERTQTVAERAFFFDVAVIGLNRILVLFQPFAFTKLSQLMLDGRLERCRQIDLAVAGGLQQICRNRNIDRVLIASRGGHLMLHLEVHIVCALGMRIK